MTDTTQEPIGRPRGGRTEGKSSVEEVMEPSRNLPSARSVLKAAVQDATPGQLGLLAELFHAENLSRERSKRLRLLKNAGFPQAKELDGYDWSTVNFPDDWGRIDLLTLDFIERAEDMVLYGDVGCGKTHLAIAIGRQACRQAIPVGFFTASGLIMRLRKAKQENALEHELDRIGRNRLLIIDELGYLPIDIDGARLLFQIVADSYERRSVVNTGNLESGRWGDVFARRRHGRRVSIDRIIHHGRIIRFHGESYRNTHSLMNH
jgi:DNA replication protein DnaC